MPKGVLAQLFGPEEISEIIFDELKLPRHPGKDLPQKKVLSMTKKYWTIPTYKLFYYPALPDTPKTLTATVSQRVNKHKRHKGARSGQ